MLGFRKQAVTGIQLCTDKSGLPGEEIEIKSNIIDPREVVSIKTQVKQTPKHLDKIQKFVKVNERKLSNKISSPYIKEDDLKDIKDKFADLTIVEKNVTNLGTTKTGGNSRSESVCNSLKSDSTDIPLVSGKERNKVYSKTLHSMSQWITDHTRTFLNITIDESQPKMTEHTNVLIEEGEQNKLERFRWEYIKLCARLDQEEIDDQKYDETVLKNAKQKNKKKKSVTFNEASILSEHNKSCPQTKQESENKHNDHDEPNGNGAPETDMFAPPSDSNSQGRRKRAFLKEIDSTLNNLLMNQFDPMEVYELYSDIKKLVDTFHLENDNTLLSTKYSSVIVLVLLRVLAIFNVANADRLNDIFCRSTSFMQVMHIIGLNVEAVDDDIRSLFRT